MFMQVKGYILKDSNTVVLEKEHIQGASADDFEEVSICLTRDFIKEQHETLLFVEDDEDFDDDDDFDDDFDDDEDDF